MADFENDELPMLLETRAQPSDETLDSKFQKLVSRTQSAPISIPKSSMKSYERQTSRSERKNPFMQMNDSLDPTSGTRNLLQESTVVTGNKVAKSKTENFATLHDTGSSYWNNNYDGTNEHLLRSGQLGMCNDPYCTTCPTYFKDSQLRTPKALNIYDPKCLKFHNALDGDPKGFVRKLFSFCSSYVPGVMNPHTKVVQQWNNILAISCLVAIFVDPLFYFLLYVQQDYNCIDIDWTMTTTLVSLRSINDLVYFFNILLKFRLAYVSPESRVLGIGDLVDHPKKIALHYLQDYFLFDLFLVLPLPQIMILFVLPNSLSGTNYAKNLQRSAILVQYIPRLFRFLPLLIGQSPTGFIFESAWANFIINILMFLLAGHVVGSCWYLFGLQRVDQCLRDACHNSNITGCMKFIDCGYNDTSGQTSTLWKNNADAIACLNASSGQFSYGIYYNAVPLIIRTNMVRKYVYSLFWGFQQISTYAGNLIPSYFVWEAIFVSLTIALGLLLIALLIGNIQNFLRALVRRREEMQLRRHDVEQWMSHRRLPEDLRRKVRQAERYTWAATRGVNEEMLMENLPKDLQRDIRRHLFNFIKKIKIFSLMDEPIFDAICERLRQKTYIEESRILRQGDLVEKMIFVVRGKLESIGDDGIRVPLSEGDACGEELLTWYLEHSSVSLDGRKVRFPGQGLLSNRTVNCLTNVEAFSIRAADLEEVTILFTRFLRSPHVQAALRYESPYWRSLAATRIQVAWRYRKKCLKLADSSLSY